MQNCSKVIITLSLSTDDSGRFAHRMWSCEEIVWGKSHTIRATGIQNLQLSQQLFSGSALQICTISTGSTERRLGYGRPFLSMQSPCGQSFESHDSVNGFLVWSCSFPRRDLSHGDDVNNILDKCPWWASYKGTNVFNKLLNFLDQRHDLFITNTPTVGYLTGPTATIAGYLTVKSFIHFDCWYSVGCTSRHSRNWYCSPTHGTPWRWT